MTPRWGAVLALALAPALAQQAHSGTAPSGTYSGTYDCSQGVTGLSLSIIPEPGNRLSALFYFYPVPPNAGVPRGCFAMAGQWDSLTGAVELRAGNWLLRPPSYVTVDLQGRLDGAILSGRVIGPGCTAFSLRPDPAPPPPPAACRAAVLADAGGSAIS